MAINAFVTGIVWEATRVLAVLRSPLAVLHLSYY